MDAVAWASFRKFMLRFDCGLTVTDRRTGARIFGISFDELGEAHIVEKAFGIGPSTLSEAVTMFENRLQDVKA